jgi:hypothetical protein
LVEQKYWSSQSSVESWKASMQQALGGRTAQPASPPVPHHHHQRPDAARPAGLSSPARSLPCAVATTVTSTNAAVPPDEALCCLQSTEAGLHAERAASASSEPSTAQTRTGEKKDLPPGLKRRGQSPLSLRRQRATPPAARRRHAAPVATSPRPTAANRFGPDCFAPPPTPTCAPFPATRPAYFSRASPA